MMAQRYVIVFQLLAATECDAISWSQAKADGDSRTSKGQKIRSNVVLLSGRDAQGHSIVLVVSGFRPSLRIQAKDCMRAQSLAGEHLFDCSSVQTGCEPDVHEESEHALEFRGFHPRPTQFVRWTFRSNLTFLSTRKKLREGGVTAYDAALPASMQMLARLAISPCAWVVVPCSKSTHMSTEEPNLIHCVEWTDIARSEDPPAAVAPFKVMAYDIECASSHGEFPCAKKGYERLARELSALPEGHLGTEHQIAGALAAAFGLKSGVQGIGRVHTKQGIVPSFDTIHEVSESMCAALKKSSAASGSASSAIARAWHRSKKKQDSMGPCSSDDEESAPSATQAQLPSSTSSRSRYFLILQLLQDAKLPQVEGDEVIQIGAVTRTLGADSEDRHIFVLGDCDPVSGTSVHTFKCEKQMLQAFLGHIKNSSPDFFTGYNTHGFDTSYIDTRCAELGMCLDGLTGSKLDPSLYHANTFQSSCGHDTQLDLQSSIIARKGSDDREDTFLDMQGRVVFDLMHVIQKGHNLPSYRLDAVAQHFTGERKDDVSPAQIFASHHGTACDRALVASYCIQDCALVLHLADKLNTIMNAIGMADVCSVPVSWIFSRGQGCKTLSLVSRQCWQDGFAIPAMSRGDVKVDYEGATVLEPQTGAYIDDPVVVLDFASLYPSSMISSNISHDTYVEASAKDDDARLSGVSFGDTLEFDIKQTVVDRESGAVLRRERNGTTCARFVTASTRRGVVPRILERLLAERKRVRRQIKDEPDAFKRSTLDGLQLAYKVTANSLYGQLGAPTSPVFLPDLAAATTAVGRRMLQKLKSFAEEERGAKVIYGDTDSCFMLFSESRNVPRDDLRGRIAAAVQAGTECSDAFRSHIPAPHNAEYEKVLCPFVLLSKKRYVGNLYEDADSDPKRSSMGIVLKRRDNAPIVKRIYGGVIDRLMLRDIPGATAFAQAEVLKLAQGKVPVDDLVITKTLRAPSAYVNPDTIAHVVLARRMNERQPGSAPAVGERIPYVFVVMPKATLQGERIEHPEYLTQQRIDYTHYLTNQVQKPLTQLMGALIDSMPGSRVEQSQCTPKQVEKEVFRLIFQRAAATAPAVRDGLRDISAFFKPQARR